ncbi:16S rRNA (cytosine(1402)-N(4))-methyltransferase RsmH [Carboxylicivirga sp. M1479]|uniref:16S rRNA (cytosine(1402)-N(4))-methyltransferase RsmH n=1 Tax=Carboxylicivirga sp. M1479 TaxID=2594476 RepID=UPI0011778E3D|nr:16S rRNA (cytosine(1402)-N(4))-methyltransferase RsmH [Carboxylicivirga sp. M1479]TRX71863.1 16S rRNA (cytosine(1402)-N(4))-methyltransferase RsmH [Carboxylicivirga sp. M1479]
MEQGYHVPVLLKESVDGLNIHPGGIYVDLTFGGGGHSREILSRLGEDGKLVVFDQDEDAYKNRPQDDRLLFVRHNFQYLSHFLRYMGIEKVDGILGDLGVSSHHFDAAERGFSFRFEGKLDMRMGQGLKMTAADVVNSYSLEDMKRIFWQYGEIKSSYKLSSEIINQRSNKPFETTTDLKTLAEKIGPKKEQSKFLAQVFQALRIEVNKEMDVLKSVLMQSTDVIKKGGRLSVISYHSLEDRLVKNFVRSGDCDKTQADKDLYGQSNVPFKATHRKIIIPNEEEIARNNRARSAKLRIAERV